MKYAKFVSLFIYLQTPLGLLIAENVAILLIFISVKYCLFICFSQADRSVVIRPHKAMEIFSIEKIKNIGTGRSRIP